MTAAIIIILAIALCVACWFLFDNSCRLEFTERKLADSERIRHEVAAVATTTVPILDAAYESASGDVKAWLDTHIFDRLSSAMNGDTKAAVHAIRAEEKADT